MWTGKRIKALRAKYNELQVEFCRRLGVKVGTLREWEQDVTVPPDYGALLLDRLEEDVAEGKVRELQPA